MGSWHTLTGPFVLADLTTPTLCEIDFSERPWLITHCTVLHWYHCDFWFSSVWTNFYITAHCPPPALCGIGSGTLTRLLGRCWYTFADTGGTGTIFKVSSQGDAHIWIQFHYRVGSCLLTGPGVHFLFTGVGALTDCPNKCGGFWAPTTI